MSSNVDEKASRKKKGGKRRIEGNGREGRSPPMGSQSVKEQVLSDEDLARQLQAQFNQEEERAGVANTSVISDEEYAQRLQAAYFRRELKKDSRDGAKKDPKKDDKKKDDSSEQKPTLWGRLFGGTTKPGTDEEDDDSDDKEDKKDLKKGKDKSLKDKDREKATEKDKDKKKSESPPVNPAYAYPPYGYYPQSPFMINPQGTVQYVPLTSPGGQYMLTNTQ